MIDELKDFFAEVEEERNYQELTAPEFSQKAFGNVSRYYVLKKTENPSPVALKALADALGKKLVICIVEKED